MPSPSRYRDSAKARRICFETWKRHDHLGRPYMDCRCGRGQRPDCGQRIDPVRQRWRADHNIPWADGGEDTADNLYPVLEKCDQETKAPEDTARIAKNKRIRDKRIGIKRAGRPMAGSLDSPFKKKMDGTVERR